MEEIDVVNPEIMAEALGVYAENSLDFVDCILIAYHRITGANVVSFDRKLNKRLE